MQEFPHEEMLPYPYIYLQYSSNDTDRVIPIIKALKATHYHVVFDHQFHTEDKFRILDVESITRAAALILFFSKNASKSRLIKDTVKCATKLHNFDKLCICLDDIKFGLSFGDLKKNYTLFSLSKTDNLIEELQPYLDVYLLPPGTYSSDTEGDELVEENGLVQEDEWPQDIESESSELFHTDEFAPQQLEFFDDMFIPVEAGAYGEFEDYLMPEEPEELTEILPTESEELAASLSHEPEELAEVLSTEPENFVNDLPIEPEELAEVFPTEPENFVDDLSTESENFVDDLPTEPEDFADDLSTESEELAEVLPTELENFVDDLPIEPEEFDDVLITIPDAFEGIPTAQPEKMDEFEDFEDIRENKPLPPKSPAPTTVKASKLYALEPDVFREFCDDYDTDHHAQSSIVFPSMVSTPDVFEEFTYQYLETQRETDLSPSPADPIKSAASTPHDSADEAALWNNIRRKMHVRAIRKSRFFISPHQSASPAKESLDTPPQSEDTANWWYPQDDTIESITIEYPTDEDIADIPEKITPPAPISMSEHYHPDSDAQINEILHKPETVDDTQEPIPEPINRNISYMSIDTPEPEPIVIPETVEQSEPIDTPEPEPTVIPKPVAPSEPIDTPEPEPTVIPKPVAPSEPIDVPEPEQTVIPKPVAPSEPIDVPEPEQTVIPKPVAPSEPIDTPEPEPTVIPKPVTPSEPIDASKPEPKVTPKPVTPSEPIDASKPEPTVTPKPVAQSEPIDTPEPESDKETFEESGLNAYTFFENQVLSDISKDSQWDGKSFFEESIASKDAYPDADFDRLDIAAPFNDPLFSPFSDETVPASYDLAARSAELAEADLLPTINDDKTVSEENSDIKIQILVKAAEQGNADAQYKLGASYEHGDRVEQNYVKAAHWYILSSNRGNANAQFNLANMYEHGLGVSRNLYEAADLYHKAAEQGHSNAQTHYGICLQDGIGTEQDPAQAVKWFVKASEKGNAAAIYRLGVCFECGQGVERDFSHALQLYLSAANQGFAEAQNALANCYMSGNGIPANYTEAVRWYSKAARNGNVPAQFNIGFCCENGLGIEKNADMAYRFYRIAADNGSESALKRLTELGFVKDSSN